MAKTKAILKRTKSASESKRARPTLDEGQFNRSLGTRLKEIRKAGSFSQIYIGTYLGIHQTAVCRIEAGEQTITPQQLDLLARLYGLRVDDLINGAAK